MTTRDPIYSENVPTLAPWQTTLSVSLRTRLFLTGVLYPIFCFLFVASGARPKFSDYWQDGRLDTYASLILSAPVFYIFMPWIVFSIIGFGHWCFAPKSYDKKWVRFAIYTGVLLTLQFNILLLITVLVISALMGTIFMVVQAVIFCSIGWLAKRIFRFTILHLMIATTAVAIMAAILIQFEDAREAGSMVMFLIPMMVGGAPFMALVSFCRAGRAVNFLHRTNGLTVAYPGPNHYRDLRMWFFTWIIGLAVSWKFAIDLMFEEYSKLPASPPPGCFISMAAAHGHRRFVGSQININGKLVSMQMARCKMVELAIKALFPGLHWTIRSVYNTVGPSIANQCRRNKWSADAAYLAMKPFEWLALIVQFLFGISNIKVRALYSIEEN
jgi:hypothetical protein